MHWRSVSAERPHQFRQYRDVVAEVRAELHGLRRRRGCRRSRSAKLIDRPRAGIRQDRTTQLGAAARVARVGGHWIPVLLGASRKRFLGTLLAGPDGAARPPDGRETATAVMSALAALHGAWGVRVHDVRASVDAVKVVGAWTRAGAIGSDG